MNLMKLFIFVMISEAINICAFAHTGQLELYISCAPTSKSCQKLPFPSEGEKIILVKKHPEMTIGREEISEAEITKSEDHLYEIKIRLIESAAKKFTQMTGANIGKKLAIVLNNKVLNAPVIRGVIESKVLIFRLDFDDKDINNLLENLPWIKNTKGHEREQINNKGK